MSLAKKFSAKAEGADFQNRAKPQKQGKQSTVHKLFCAVTPTMIRGTEHSTQAGLRSYPHNDVANTPNFVRYRE